jgi:hypothetical protein
MTRIFVSILFFCAWNLMAQESALLSSIDTLKYSSRTGGRKLDSLDWIHTGISNMLPGGSFQAPWGRYGTDYENFHHLLNHFTRIEKSPKPVYAGLPHLGFAYSFGSFSTQFLQADYQQTFKKKNHLTIQFSRNSRGEALRNSSFKNNTLHAVWLSDLKKYTQQTEISSFNSERFLSGGISDLAVIEEQGIEFAPVFKSNAKSVSKVLDLSTQHYLSLTKDSLRKIGVTYHADLKTENRVFTETDVLSLIYPVINIDTFQTRDQFQESALQQTFGLFLKTSKLKSELLIGNRYRGFQNLGVFRDTMEWGATWNTSLMVKGVTVRNAFYLNLVGAKGEISEKLELSFQQNNFLKHAATFQYEQKLPSLFQRSYFANNAAWNLNVLELQKQTQVNYRLLVGKNELLEFKTSFASISDRYQLIQDTWRNDTLASWEQWCSSVRANLAYKSWHFQPAVYLNYTNFEAKILPTYDLRARLFWNKKLFKAKKFDFIVGLDARYQDAHAWMSYDSRFDVYRLDQVLVSTQQPLLRFDFFTGFQIDEFRFYFKFENIDYFWNNKTLQEQQSFPLSPNVLRLGLTWDFFN